MSGIIINPYSFATGSAFSTKSLNFDGVDDYVETPAIFSLLDGLSNFAFSFWFKPSNFVYNSIFWIDGTSATANDAQIQLILRPNYLIWYFNAFGYYVYSNTSNPLVADTWYHVLCTRDDSRAIGEKARIYINGVNESQYDSSRFLGALDTSTSGLKIGDGDYGPPFLGNIDEFAVYNQDMAAYIDEIYTGTPNDLSALATAPVPNVWYRMGENSTFSSPQILMPENTNKDKVSNYSMAFDGVDDYVDCGNDSSLHNSNFTISLWVYPTSLSGSVEIISNGLGAWANKNHGFNIGRYWSGYRFYVGDGTTSYSLAPATAVVDTWQHLFMSYDGTNVKTYLNGVLQDTVAVPNISYSASAQNSFRIGKSANSGQEFPGNIDEVSLFDSAKAIGDLWDGSGKPTDLTGESGLVSWWRMGEKATFSTNWTVPDEIGSNDGTSANMTIEDRVGNAPGSSNNALSYNMVEADIEEEAP